MLDRSKGVQVIQDRERVTLHGFIRDSISDKAEAIFTDEWPAYLGCGDENTRHETVNHSAKQWVVGDVHTNGVEGVWSLLKRSIIGAFHKVSIKHLDRYLDELEWRFNNRDNPNMFKDALMRMAQTDPLRYRALTA